MTRERKLPSGMWKRSDTYYARFRAGGRLVRKRLSTDFHAARELLNELRARADRADFDLIDNRCRLDELREQWLRHCTQTLRPATVKRYRENIVNILGAIPARLVSQLTAQTILQFRRERLESGSSPRTVNMDVGALSMMLNWGVAQEMIAGNPLAKIKPLPTDEKRKQRRPLTVEEVQAIFDASQERLRPVWRMFATTGIRHDELTKMRFVDVDFERATVTVRSSTAKNHREREIPLDDEMLATIQALQDDALDRRPIPGRTPEGSVSRDHVFVTGANTPWRNNLLRAFYAVCRRAGIEGAHRNGSVDLHSLRVTFATLTLENGASPKAVQMMLGHATLAMTMTVYAKATERSKRAALNALPFAKASDPGHIIPMQSAHTMRTRRKIAAQPVAG